MQSIRHILVPTDFSAASHHAIDVASGLAKSLGASIDLFFVWHPPTLIPPGLMIMAPEPRGGGLSLEDLAKEQAELGLAEARATLQKRGIETHVRLGVGDPAHEIIELAGAGHFELVVMATRGRSGLPHLLLGSVAEKVVRHAQCPVVTVRQPAP